MIPSARSSGLPGGKHRLSSALPLPMTTAGKRSAGALGGADRHRRPQGRCRQPQPAGGAQSGATAANGAARVLGTSYAVYDDRFEVDPATGGAWTKAGVDALQAGVEVVA